jgi:hypothetical protein
VPKLSAKDAVVRGQQSILKQALGAAQETVFPL